MEKITANAVLMHNINALENAVSVNYIGERNGNIGSVAGTGFVAGQSITIPAQTLLNLKTTYKVNSALQVSLIVMNITEETVLYPEYVRSRIDSIPGDSGRNVFVKATYKF